MTPQGVLLSMLRIAMRSLPSGLRSLIMEKERLPPGLLSLIMEREHLPRSLSQQSRPQLSHQ